MSILASAARGLAAALVLCSALAPEVPAAPATTDTAVVTLPVYEVSEARPLDDPVLRVTPGFARAYDVSQSYGRVRTASDVLTGSTGVHVRQFGGLGSFSAVSIRGSAASQVAFYLDGVPLNQAQYGVVNASDLPIEALDRVEVYRGTAPLSFDAPGGGAVQFVSRDDRRGWARLATGAGSFGTLKTDAAVGFARGRVRGMLVGQHLESDGDFDYLDDNATPANADDDTVRARLNNSFSSNAWTGRLAAGLGAVDLSLTHDLLAKRQGAPGTGANTALQAALRTDRSVTGLRATLPRASFAPTLLLYGAQHRDRFTDPARELTGSRQDNDDRTTRLGARLEGARELPGGHRLSGLAEARRERYTPAMNLPEPRTLPTSEREIVVFGLEDRWTLAGGRLGVSGQVRREATFDDFPAGPAYPGALPSPAVARTTRHTRGALGLRADVVHGARGTISVRASTARLARVPTLEELFGNRGGVHGNPRARPEQVRTHDAGVTALWRLGGAGRGPTLEGQLAAYRSTAQDLLVFVQNSASSSVAQNVSAARMTGTELGARLAWPAGATVDVSWTRQWTRDEGEVAYWRGNALPGRPRDEASLRASNVLGRFRPFFEARHVSAHFLDRANLQRVGARTLFDAGTAAMLAGAPVEVAVEVRNLTDAQAHDFGGYPLPGRSVYLGLRWRVDSFD